MSSSNLRLSKLSLGLLAALAVAPVFAQSTSSGIAGRVTNAGGQPIAGAEVTITHVESGTSSRVTTDANGRYTASGLRPGGPYSVKIHTASGDNSQDGVYLSLDKTAAVDATIGSAPSGELGTVVVSGLRASPLFSPDKAGAGTDVSRRTIEALPSANGNIQDYMRLDPRVAFIDRASGVISAAGQNPRYNAVRIDGVSASDTFGLEGNNMPTRRQPVSMEAIEAIKIDLSNYDTTITGGTGAVVNAVTRSGTNQFHGSVYGQYRDGDWYGKGPAGYPNLTSPAQPFNGFTKETTYGFTLGGPIMKDRLFFFVNYEKYKQAAPGADVANSAIGAGRFSQADISAAQQAFQKLYGVSAGGTDSNGNTDLTEYAAKIDWNISDRHRFSLRYSDLKQSKLRINGYGRATQASLSSYWYQHDKNIKSTVAQLFSDWTDNFSTEAKLSYRDYSAVRTPPVPGTPSITIATGTPSSSTGVGTSPNLFLGTEVNSQYNILTTKTINGYASGIYHAGSHAIKFGIDYSTNKIYNLYAPYVDGALTFNSIADFVAYSNSPTTVKPAQITYRYPVGGALDNMAAAYTYKTLGLFLQDQWTVNDRLTLTYGVRGDKFDVGSRPAYNQYASAYWGYDNSDVGGGKYLWEPRLGFNLKLSDERMAQIRGGVGLFQGDSPAVWMSNAYNTTGLNYSQVDTYAKAGAPSSAPRMNTNFVTGDFKQPSSWKANLAMDWEIGGTGIIASAELLATKVKDALYYQRLDVGAPTMVGMDGRNMFWSNTTYGSGTARAKGYGSTTKINGMGIGDVLLLANTNKGGSEQMTFSLSKPYSRKSDWTWNLGYTFTNAKEVAGLTSSTATSGWNYTYVYNANENAVNRSRYEIRNRFSGYAGWHHNFFGDYKTEVGLVYEGRSGRPYSFVFVNDMNGDGRSANDLFYVPAGPGDVLFGTLNTTTGVYTANPAMEKAFFDYMAGNKQLNQYAGRVAPANGGIAPWVNTFDLRISQELPGFFKGHKSEIALDIFNVGNLVNKKWGRIIDYGFFADQRIASFQGIDPKTGKYVYSYSFADRPTVANADADGFNIGVSQWSMQLTLKYKF